VTRWWEPFYDDLLATMLLDAQSPAEVDDAARFLARALDLRPGARVFDQCCGLGHLAIALAAGGMRVVGVDQAAAYVARGNERARSRGLDVELSVGDAFDHVAAPACDGAYNWWTSYGYADTDEENARMIERAFESLRPGARFALDVPNLAGLCRAFLPSVVTRRAVEGGELLLVRESELDLAAGVLRKKWTYLLPDGRRVEHPSAVRLSMPHEIAARFREVGFVDVTIHGSTRGEPIALESPRCIVVGRRPS
jgi:SAM-dependent methyltransferase